MFGLGYLIGAAAGFWDCGLDAAALVNSVVDNHSLRFYWCLYKFLVV